MTLKRNSFEKEHENIFERYSSLWALLFFLLLAVLVTYPIAFRLSDFTILHLYTDDLLEAWTLEWDVHSLLGGPDTLRNIWHSNIFYPYLTTLAFSEHLLATAVSMIPVVLLGQTPLVSTNVGILVTSALSGWGLYLLVTWLTGNRWAGFVAGVAFAFAPYRLGHMTQLHLISTHWIPFIFLVMTWLIKFNRTRDLILLIIFTNLQFFSAVNYAPLVALAIGIWTLSYLTFYRNRLTISLFGRLSVYAAVTVVLNWPVLRIYQDVSEEMQIVRTLGDAKVYGATMLNYIIPMGNSLLYGRLLGLPTHLDYLGTVHVSAFPGIIVFLLALVGMIFSFRTSAPTRLKAAAWALLVIIGLGFTLSFGANDEAFGPELSPIVGKLLPYPYLYQVVPVLQGLRVPIRFALLVTFGLSVLAGAGFSQLNKVWNSRLTVSISAAALLCLLIVIEHLPAPLPGVFVPEAGEEMTWLAENTPPDAAIIELPYYLHTQRSNQELLREYYSTQHWRSMVNGASGFKPGGLIELGKVLDSFPDPASFDVLQHTGVDYVVLHQDEYEPAAWDNIIALLPGYLPVIGDIRTVDSALILQLEMPSCRPVKWEVQPDALLRITNANAASGTEAPANDPSRWQSVDIPFANGAILQAVDLTDNPTTCDLLSIQLRWLFPSYAGEKVVVVLVDRFDRTVVVDEAQPLSGAESPVTVHQLPLLGSLPPGTYQLQVRLLTGDGDTIDALGLDGMPISQMLSVPVTIHPHRDSEPPGSSVSQLANNVRFLGVAGLPAQAHPGDWLRFTLNWQADAPIDVDYTVFTQLLGPNGQIWAQQDNPPRGGWYPTTLWQPQQVVKDDYAFRLDTAAPAGSYRLIVGMYNSASGERVQTTSGADFLEVGTVTVP